MDTVPLFFTTRFIAESFISYHLIWHIPLKHILWHHFSWSVPTVVRGHLQNVSSKTENYKGFFVNRTTLSRFLSYKVSRLRSLLKFQDFAVLLASPSNCYGLSWVSTWLCLVVPVWTIRQMWIAWQSATVPNKSISDVLQSEWRWRRGPRGEGHTHIRSTGMLLKNAALKDIISYITHYLPASYFFRLNTLKGIAKAPALDLLTLNTLRATKTSFLSPKRYDELPRPGGAWIGNPNCALLASCRQGVFSISGWKNGNCSRSCTTISP